MNVLAMVSHTRPPRAGCSDNSFFAFALPSDKQAAANATAHNATTTPKRMGYGNYCGPNPDLNVSTGCRQSYPALDIVDGMSSSTKSQEW